MIRFFVFFIGAGKFKNSLDHNSVELSNRLAFCYLLLQGRYDLFILALKGFLVNTEGRNTIPVHRAAQGAVADTAGL